MRLTLSELIPNDFLEILAGDPEELDVHLQLVEKHFMIGNCSTQLHCHCLTVDANICPPGHIRGKWAFGWRSCD